MPKVLHLKRYGPNGQDVNVLKTQITHWSLITYNGLYGSEVHLESGKKLNVGNMPAEIETMMEDESTIMTAAEFATLNRQAQAFRHLVECLGTSMDGSNQSVRIGEDDATRTFHVVIGADDNYGRRAKRHWADSLEEALKQAAA